MATFWLSYDNDEELKVLQELRELDFLDESLKMFEDAKMLEKARTLLPEKDADEIKEFKVQLQDKIWDLENDFRILEKSLSDSKYRDKEATDKINSAWDLLKQNERKINTLKNKLESGNEEMKKWEMSVK